MNIEKEKPLLNPLVLCKYYYLKIKYLHYVLKYIYIGIN